MECGWNNNRVQLTHVIPHLMLLTFHSPNTNFLSVFVLCWKKANFFVGTKIQLTEREARVNTGQLTTARPSFTWLQISDTPSVSSTAQSIFYSRNFISFQTSFAFVTFGATCELKWTHQGKHSLREKFSLESAQISFFLLCFSSQKLRKCAKQKWNQFLIVWMNLWFN